MTTTTSPLVAGYSHSLNVSVVASEHVVVSSCTTTTEVTVVLKYAQVPFAMAADCDCAAVNAAAETALTVETADDDEIAVTAAAEVVAMPDDAPRTPAAKRPTMVRLFILVYMSFLCVGWLVSRWVGGAGKKGAEASWNGDTHEMLKSVEKKRDETSVVEVGDGEDQISVRSEASWA